jgi:hypothetical protein
VSPAEIALGLLWLGVVAYVLFDGADFCSMGPTSEPESGTCWPGVMSGDGAAGT